MITILIGLALASAGADVAIHAQAWAEKARPFATCSVGPDCETKWKRASDWIRENTRFKIAVDQPGLLSTPGAIYANTDLSFTLTKTRRADGRYDLNVYAWCGNVISCNPKPKSAMSRLAQVVDAP